MGYHVVGQIVCPANCIFSQLVGILNPVNHKELHQGWKQTSVYLQVIHSTSHYTTNRFTANNNSRSIHSFGTQTQKNSHTCFGAYLYSTSTQHGNLHPTGWPILFCRPTQEPVLTTANVTKLGRGFGQMQVNGPKGQKLARKKSLTVGLPCMAIYWPISGFTGGTFKLCVLNKWDSNFCVRSSPQRGVISQCSAMGRES